MDNLAYDLAENIIKVGMADLKIALRPYLLTTLGLGSCVGICLYDRISGIIGMAHSMLPYRDQVKNNENIAKFADTATEEVLEKMLKMGAAQSRIIAKLAGGAQMFTHTQFSDIMQIGARNVISAKEKLKELKIPIVAEDTGGNHGRTIILCSNTGDLQIKTIGHGVTVI